MKSPLTARLWSLIAALVLVAGGTIYGLSVAWRRVQLLESKLTSSQLESFQLASEVHRGLLGLNNSMLNYTLVRDSQSWAQFEQASGDLDRWIDDHDPSLINSRSFLTTEAERRIFAELNRAYDDYMSSARAVHNNGRPALITAAELSQLDPFDREAQHMRDLVKRLATAHRQAEAGFIATTTASLDSVRLILIASIVFLLALVAAMGWVIYHDLISPLRQKLAQSQHQLERQEKLATLGTLAAGIAHEIRNPLTSLKARLYTLEKHLLTVPAARRDTDIIGAEISRLERIVQDVLSFARPSEPQLTTLHAGPLLQEVAGLLAPGLESRGLQLVVEGDPTLRLQGDGGHLKQALVNLVRNAAEAIDGPGTVTLRARTARVAAGGSSTSTIFLEVMDTGRGITPEAEKRLFDPFFSTKDTGTGLGLAMTARIVEKHGGTIEYQTRLGQGTTFSILLPSPA